MSSPERSAGLAVLCRVGQHVCALPIEDVEATMRPLPIEALPDLPPFVLGLSIIHGTPTPVVHLGRLLGALDQVDQLDAGSAQRFVLLRVGARRVALAVGSVVGIRRLADCAPSDVPPLIACANADAVTRLGTLDAQLLLVMQGARAVPESVWRALEQRTA